jgi:hypothetical protein
VRGGDHKIAADRCCGDQGAIMADDAITFDQFGKLFLQALLTDDLLDAQVTAAIASTSYVETEQDGVSIQGTVKRGAIAVGDPTTPPAKDVLTKVVTITLSVRLAVDGKSLPAYTVTITMRINFTTYAPLVLFAEIPPLTDDDVVLSSGIDAYGVVRDQLVAQINQRIQNSLSSRIIDLQAILLETPASTKDPSSPVVSLASDELAPRGKPGMVQIGPNQYCNIELLLRQEEAIKLLIYAQMPEPLPAISGGGVDLNYSFGPMDDEDPEGSGDDVSNGWSDMKYRIVIPYAKSYDEETYFIAPQAGRYRLRLINDALSKSPVNVVVVQDRLFSAQLIEPDGLADFVPGQRISFAQFGENLINIGLSPDFFREEVQAQLSAFSMPKPWTWSSPFGTVTFALGDLQLNDVEALESDQPESSAFRSAQLKACLDMMGAGGKNLILQVPFQATVVFLIATTGLPTAGSPPTIDVSLYKVEPSILVEQITGSNGATVALAKTLIGIINDQVIGWLESLLNSFLEQRPFAIQSHSIPDVAAGMVEQTQSGPPDPPPPSDNVSDSGHVTGGQPACYPVTLAKDQPVTITATLHPLKAPQGIFAEAWLAICDENDGMFDSDSASWDRGITKPQTLTISFTPPADGPYHVRLRAHPQDMEDWQSIAFNLHIENNPPVKSERSRSADAAESEQPETAEAATGTDLVYRLSTGRAIHLFVECPIAQSGKGDLDSYYVKDARDIDAIRSLFHAPVCQTCLRMRDEGEADEPSTPASQAPAELDRITAVYGVDGSNIFHLTPNCPALAAAVRDIESDKVSSDLDIAAIEEHFDKRVCDTCINMRYSEAHARRRIPCLYADVRLFSDQVIVFLREPPSRIEIHLDQIGERGKSLMTKVRERVNKKTKLWDFTIQYRRRSWEGKWSWQHVTIPFDDADSIDLFERELDAAIDAFG